MQARRVGFLAITIGAVLLLAHSAQAQIYQLKEMNTEQIRTLDRGKTVVIIPGGIVEEHGPYLPAFSDGYQNEYVAQRVAEAIVARPGWAVVMFPTIPLGAGGGNQVGLKQILPPTFHVHFATLRAVFMDLASEFGEAGFRWIFVIHGHGALDHQLALDQASDFFNDTYKGTMVHLTGLEPPSPTPVNLGLTDAEKKENGMDIHAGLSETSQILFLRPGLVRPGYRDAKAYSGPTRRDLVQIGSQQDWPGYFASPRLATAARGAQLLLARSRDMSDLALHILDGFDYRALQRSSQRQSKDDSVRAHKDASDEHDRMMVEKQENWLQRKGLK